MEVTTDSDGEQWLHLSPDDFDLWNKVPVCGCEPGLLAHYHRVLKLAVMPRELGPDGLETFSLSGGDRTELWWSVIENVLDHIGATEHGSNIRWSWRTFDGERLLAIFDALAATDWEATPVTSAS